MHNTLVHFFLLVRAYFHVPCVVQTVYGQGPQPVEEAACMALIHTACMYACMCMYVCMCTQISNADVMLCMCVDKYDTKHVEF